MVKVSNGFIWRWKVDFDCCVCDNYSHNAYDDDMCGCCLKWDEDIEVRRR